MTPLLILYNYTQLKKFLVRSSLKILPDWQTSKIFWNIKHNTVLLAEHQNACKYNVTYIVRYRLLCVFWVVILTQITNVYTNDTHTFHYIINLPVIEVIELYKICVINSPKER